MRIELVDIVRRLIGPIDAIGESNADDIRFQNLHEVFILAEALIDDLQYAALTANRPEASMREIGKSALSLLQELREKLDE